MSRAGKCRECNLNREVATASRHGGGSYNRAGRNYRSSICLPCAAHLLSFVTPGHYTVSRWSIGGLRYAIRDLGGCPSTTPDNTQEGYNATVYCDRIEHHPREHHGHGRTGKEWRWTE